MLNLLRRILPDSQRHEGCDGISLHGNQDDENNVISFTKWRTRKSYDDYLKWRTDKGDTATLDEMLSQPMGIRYFDKLDMSLATTS